MDGLAGATVVSPGSGLTPRGRQGCCLASSLPAGHCTRRTSWPRMRSVRAMTSLMVYTRKWPMCRRPDGYGNMESTYRLCGCRRDGLARRGPHVSAGARRPPPLQSTHRGRGRRWRRACGCGGPAGLPRGFDALWSVRRCRRCRRCRCRRCRRCRRRRRRGGGGGQAGDMGHAGHGRPVGPVGHVGHVCNTGHVRHVGLGWDSEAAAASEGGEAPEMSAADACSRRGRGGRGRQRGS